LVTTAGGLVVLAAKQDVPSAATTGVQVTNLALEFARAISGADGQRVFRKMQKKCADDLRDWAASEGLKVGAERTHPVKTASARFAGLSDPA
jgi:hypothetical protein